MTDWLAALRHAFLKWHAEIGNVLHNLAQLHSTGLDVVVSTMEKAFPGTAVRKSAARYGEHLRRQRVDKRLHVGPTGIITTAATGPRLRDHTFHIDAPRSNP